MSIHPHIIKKDRLILFTLMRDILDKYLVITHSLLKPQIVSSIKECSQSVKEGYV